MNTLRFGSAAASLMLVLASGSACAQTDLATSLRKLPGVKDVKAMSGKASFDISFEQPVDHKRPHGAKFIQHVFLAHADFAHPVLLETEGYSASGPRAGELKHMLGDPNVVVVEHRYFGRSVPKPVRWEHLTVKNAADDMHAIVSAFKKLYSGKWVATGASKGGQTSLFFKCYYPNDVNATVAYVAPINIGQEDPRINQFLETVGTAEDRKRVREFQIAMFKRRAEVLPLLKEDPKNYSMGLEKAYEYGILEYPYAFWQYGTPPSSIPGPDAPAAELAAQFKRVGSMAYYGDALKKRFEPFMYQAFTEIGYYNYDITDFKPYLKANPSPSNLDLCPDGTQDKIVYNPQTLSFVFHYLQYKANNVVFIYGETDAWSATQMQLLGRTNAIKIVAKGAYHNASVRLFSPDEKELFYSTMDKWLGMKLIRD